MFKAYSFMDSFVSSLLSSLGCPDLDLDFLFFSHSRFSAHPSWGEATVSNWRVL